MRKKSLSIAGAALVLALSVSAANYACAEETTEAVEEEVTQEAVDSSAFTLQVFPFNPMLNVPATAVIAAPFRKSLLEISIFFSSISMQPLCG